MSNDSRIIAGLDEYEAWTSPLLPGLKFRVVMLDPKMAADLLDRLPERQRRQSVRSIDRYAGDMLDGEFPFTGDAIRLNDKGELDDGQHRCQAVIASGVSIPTLIIEGLPPERIRNYDSGRNRNFADDLRINGYRNHALLGSLTARVWHWLHGNYGYMGVPMVQNPLYSNTSPTRAQLWSVLQDHEELVEITTHAQRVARSTPNVTATVNGMAWWLFGQVDVDLREMFFHELVNGSEENGAEYPINVLRRAATRRMRPTENREQYVWLAYYIRTWNAWLAGETLSYLRMPTPVRWDTLPQPARPDVEDPAAFNGDVAE